MIIVNEITPHRKIISKTEYISVSRWKFIPRKYFAIISILELDIYLTISDNLFIKYFINRNYVNILYEWYSLSELNMGYTEKNTISCIFICVHII